MIKFFINADCQNKLTYRNAVVLCAKKMFAAQKRFRHLQLNTLIDGRQNKGSSALHFE